MKKKTLNIKIMTKHLADTLAKEVAFREKKAQGGIAVRRGQTKGENGKSAVSLRADNGQIHG